MAAWEKMAAAQPLASGISVATFGCKPFADGPPFSFTFSMAQAAKRVRSMTGILLCRAPFRRSMVLRREINIPRQSPGVLYRQVKPWNTSARVASCWYGLPAAKNCYLPPVNRLVKSFPSFAVFLPYFFLLYLRSVLYTRMPGCGTYTSTLDTSRISLGCSSLFHIP